MFSPGVSGPHTTLPGLLTPFALFVVSFLRHTPSPVTCDSLTGLVSVFLHGCLGCPQTGNLVHFVPAVSPGPGTVPGTWSVHSALLLRNEQLRNNGAIISPPAGNFALPEGRPCHFDAPFCSRWKNQTSVFFLASVFPKLRQFLAYTMSVSVVLRDNAGRPNESLLA